MQLGYITDKGKVRNLNEDAYYISMENGIFLVADGVGGRNAGEVASNLAVHFIARKVHSYREEKRDATSIFRFFADCLEKANDAILREAEKRKDCNGMATTLVGLYLQRDNAYFFNLGDSRAYLIRDDQIKQITEDHTLVNKYVKEGKITKEEALTYPNSNMITRALGMKDYSEADFFQIDVRKNDIFLLCSDGLFGEVCDEKILELLQASNHISVALERLVEEANKAGGGDNITIVGLKVGEYE